MGTVFLLSISCFAWLTLQSSFADSFGDATTLSAFPPKRRLSEDSESGYWEDALIDRPYRKSNKKYWIFIHIIIIGYMLLGLNTVCDLYFTGSLDEMVNKWKIKPDVAGATFMAAGGSAPELFTSLIGAVVSESDVGFGTIVGSAVFNVLFVIGLCGFSAKEPIKLTWWPLARDCTYYIFGLSVLALFAQTGKKISLWEAFLLFIGYLGYCTIMYFNPQLEEMALNLKSAAVTATEMTPVTPIADTGSTVDKHHIKKSQPHFERKPTKTNVESEHDEVENNNVEVSNVAKVESVKEDADEEEEEDDIEALLEKPAGTVPQILWGLCLPVYATLYYGIPKPTETMFVATFLISLCWIAGFSFFLVYCVEILGEVLGIHIIVMGFTLLAAGTSIPDLVSSMAVARAGEGDMAVSSSIGSNIFDILVGLPIPWIIKILFVEMIAKGNGDFGVPIKSDYIVLYVIILIVMIFCVIVSIHFLKWELNKTLGVGMAVLYAIFLVLVLVVEFEKPEAFKW
jgi:K+-dependent Na+/Ca+ exchanger-like protein